MNSDWQNPARPHDVNNDMAISPLDALIIINHVNKSGDGVLGRRTHQLKPYFDANGDGSVNPLDSLVIINALNRNTERLLHERTEGESEAAPAGFLSTIFGRLPGDSTQLVNVSTRITIGRKEFNEVGLFLVDGADGEVTGLTPLGFRAILRWLAASCLQTKRLKYLVETSSLPVNPRYRLPLESTMAQSYILRIR